MLGFMIICFLVSAAPLSARDLPDLVIDRVDLRASGDCSGATPLIVGKAVIKNVGVGRGQIFTTREMIVSQVASVPSIRTRHRFVNSMRPGETVNVPIEIGKGAAFRESGKFDVRFTVDPRGVFKEENEANNGYTVTASLNCSS